MLNLRETIRRSTKTIPSGAENEQNQRHRLRPED